MADLLRRTCRSDDPVARYADRSARPGLRRRPAGVSDRQPRPGVPPARTAASSWPTTRPTGWARRTRRSPPGTTGPRRCRPRWSRPTTRCRPCSTRWRCTATCAGASRLRPRPHLGGVLYLFVRGMSAAETPSDVGEPPRGVWSWRPPAALVEALSDLFDRGASRMTDSRRRRLRRRRRAAAPRDRCAPSTGRHPRPRPTSMSRSRLARLGVDDDAVRLGAAFAARAPRLGHVCVDLASIGSTASSDTDTAGRPRRAALARRRGVDRRAWRPARWSGTDRPLHLAGTNLYLDRLWADECLVATDLLARAATAPCRGRRGRCCVPA